MTGRHRLTGLSGTASKVRPVCRRAFRPSLAFLEDRIAPAVFTVTNAAATGDGTGFVTGSLQWAIVQADNAGGANTINFAIGKGPQTITVPSGPGLNSGAGGYVQTFPLIGANTTIDATTQPGYAGKPLIAVDGANTGYNATSARGLEVGGSNVLIKGLAIEGFGLDAIRLYPGTTGAVIQGNYVGTDQTGTQSHGVGYGIVDNSDGGNLIGGTTPAARNVLAAATVGVYLYNVSGPAGDTVEGNYIGTDATGKVSMGGTYGVSIYNSPNNTIGGIIAGARNIISGVNVSSGSGVEIIGQNATGNVVEGNYIGTDVTGKVALSNAQAGIVAYSSGNTIGGTVAGARNIISGNAGDGVDVDGSNNIVEGNYIGTDVTGKVALRNGKFGVYVGSGSGNTIGGTVAGARNVISGNGAQAGIGGGSCSGLLIEGNYIGTDATGTGKLGNGGGIFLNGTTNSTIGGTSSLARNVISGNGDGVYLEACTNVAVEGNFIGTTASGRSPLGNSGRGVITQASSGCTIGGTTQGSANVIAYNGWEGIDVSSYYDTNISIRRNSIHDDGSVGGVPGIDDYGQNAPPAPGLTSAIRIASTGKTTVIGTIHAAVNTTYTLEFFANASLDAFGFAEGQTYVGALTVTTDGAGNVSFTTVLNANANLVAGHYLTATETDTAGNSSAFSQDAVVGS